MLAVLSFEKECHEALKNSDFIEKLQEKGIFSKIFALFKHKGEEQQEGKTSRRHESIVSFDKSLDRNRTHLEAIMGFSD